MLVLSIHKTVCRPLSCLRDRSPVGRLLHALFGFINSSNALPSAYCRIGKSRLRGAAYDAAVGYPSLARPSGTEAGNSKAPTD